MQYTQALAYIHAHNRFGMKLGLERMRSLMTMLGDPQEKLKFVHVAGTNGKGSTAAMTAAILRQAGYRTGLYISPYILDFCERMQVNGEMIPHEQLAELVEKLRPFADRVEGLTEFELVTALGFLWFAGQKCDVVVLEVGLGGRFDATNVITAPLACVIAPVGLDHTQVLGETVGQIAFEKCGIIKPGAKVVVHPAQDSDALAVIYEQAQKNGAEVLQPTGNGVENLVSGLQGSDFIYAGEQIHLPLIGGFQVGNALTAIAAAVCADRQLQNRLKAGDIAAGIAGVRFPARMEIICRQPLTILDGAHNPQGAAALAQALGQLVDGRPVTGVMGMLGDKNCQEVVSILAPHFKRVICVTPENPRALSAHGLAELAAAQGVMASAAHSIREAWELASAVAQSEKGCIVICGSLYAASSFRQVILEDAAE